MEKDLIGIMYKKKKSSQKTEEILEKKDDKKSTEISEKKDEEKSTEVSEEKDDKKSTEVSEKKDDKKSTEISEKKDDKKSKEISEEKDEEKSTEIRVDEGKEPSILSPMTCIIGGGAFLLGAVIGIMAMKIAKKNRIEDTKEEPVIPEYREHNYYPRLEREPVQTISVGKVHNIGRRQSQQDSLGVMNIKDGVVAVVADGMGGLANGDKVSQKIVMTLLQDAQRISAREFDNPLYAMASHANDEVNRMLGAGGCYKSGSTMIAVIAEKNGFHWFSVGDSRIYLYRKGALLQINREHIYEAELMKMAINGEISFSEVKLDKQRKGLTSFIGMGELKFIDGSSRKIPLQKDDAILLMSDGVFNTVSEEEIADILASTPNVKRAEQELEKRVLEYQNPKQDNFTAIILRF